MRPFGPSDLAGRSLDHLSITPYFGGAGRTRTHAAYPYALTVFKTAPLPFGYCSALNAYQRIKQLLALASEIAGLHCLFVLLLVFINNGCFMFLHLMHLVFTFE